MSRQPRRAGTGITILFTVLILVMVATTGLLIWLCIDMVNAPPRASAPSETIAVLPTATTEPALAETQPPETTKPEPERVVSTATVLSTGDLLMHKPLLEKARTGSGYDFSPIFKYVTGNISAADYAIANLETTFGGTDFVYQGNPAFNCPDELADAVVDAGFDMLLTVNNHCGDTMASGVTRTLEVARGKGLATLGTQLNDEEPKYSVVDINGIKIGMVAYSFASTYNGTKVSMNGLAGFPPNGTINFYTNNNLEGFYQELEAILTQMEADGAEATMIQIHWGPNEYELYANPRHEKMAQKFCDMGFDVVVGGHPHVVQPMDLLTSNTDPEHKTVVLYSMGNAVSNQRLGNLKSVQTAHTEDGVLFSVTFCKYSDGKVYVQALDLVPIWVNLADQYYILPLDAEQEEQWTQLLGLNDNTAAKAKQSYVRTMNLVGEGLEKCQTWLAEQEISREAYYQDLALNPEKYATEATEAPAETPAETAQTAAA